MAAWKSYLGETEANCVATEWQFLKTLSKAINSNLEFTPNTHHPSRSYKDGIDEKTCERHAIK